MTGRMHMYAVLVWPSSHLTHIATLRTIKPCVNFISCPIPLSSTSNSRSIFLAPYNLRTDTAAMWPAHA